MRKKRHRKATFPKWCMCGRGLENENSKMTAWFQTWMGRWGVAAMRKIRKHEEWGKKRRVRIRSLPLRVLSLQ